jgi:hypothetical protein
LDQEIIDQVKQELKDGLIPLKRKAPTANVLEEELALIVKTLPEIPSLVKELRKEQIKWMRVKQKERQRLVHSCTLIVSKAIRDHLEDERISILYDEAREKLREFDLNLLDDFQKLANHQSEILGSSGLTLIRPSPLSRQDFLHNRGILKLLLINHS